MLEADKSLFLEKIFAVYNRNLLKRNFHSIHVSGLNNLRDRDLKIPLIIYANHSSWWDGLVAFQISQNIKLDSFIMMEEKHLKKFCFFRKLGAFSVVREKPFEAIKSINYAGNLLKSKPGRTLWIFPQGEILHNDLRPLRFFKGVIKIIEKVKESLIIASAFRYEFLGEYKPEIFISFSEAIHFPTKSIKNINILESSLTALLDELRENSINNNFNNFEKLL